MLHEWKSSFMDLVDLFRRTSTALSLTDLWFLAVTAGFDAKMDAIVKKSLASCVSGVTDGVGKKAEADRRRSAPCCYSHITYDSSWIRAYQAELHRERRVPRDVLATSTNEEPVARAFTNPCHVLHRKLRQGILAQKKAERTVVKAHYRNPPQYTSVSLMNAVSSMSSRWE